MFDSRLEIVLAAKDMTANAFQSAQMRVKKMTSSVFSLTGAVAGLAGVGGIYGLISASREWVDLANQQEQAEKKLAAVVKSTGGAAGFSTEQLKNMARSLQQVTTVGDETIIQGQALLATFKEIKGDAFARTTEAALDLSEVVGTSLNSAVMQLGKALNDPVANLGALSRAGIQFTKDQKEMIKSLWETNKHAEAQNIILNELESQFGGVATAAAQTFGGAQKQVANALGDLKEQLGFVITKDEYFIALMHQAKEKAVEWGEWIKNNREELQKLVEVKKVLPGIAKGVLLGVRAWKGWVIIVNSVQAGFAKAIASIAQGLSWLLDKLAAFARFAHLTRVSEGLEDISRKFKDLSWAANKEWKENFQETVDAIAGLEGLDGLSKKIDDFFADVEKKAQKTFAGHIPRAAATASRGVAASGRQIKDEMNSAFISIEDVAEETLGASGTVVAASQAGVFSMSSLWDDFSRSLEGSLTAVFQGEFHGIKGFFKDLLDSMYSMFTSWVAKLAAQEVVMPALEGIFSSGAPGSGGGGGFGSLFSAAKWANMGHGLWDKVSGWFGSGSGAGAGAEAGAGGFSFAGMGTMGWVAALAAAEHMASGFNQRKGYSDIYVGGKKVTIGDAFSGSFFNDPLMESLSGILGGSPGPLAYADAGIKAGNWKEALKGFGALLLNPLDPLTSALLGNPISKLFGFGDKPSKFRGWTDVKLGTGPGGLFGWGYNYDPVQEYTGKYIAGRGPGNVVGKSLDAMDQVFQAIVDSFTSGINDLSASFGDGDIKSAFDQAISEIAGSFAYTEEFATRDNEKWDEYLQRVAGGLTDELDAAFGPTVALFQQLSDTLEGVNPALADFMGGLSSATQQYFDPLLSIDQKIAGAGGNDYLGGDLYSQFETYATLFETAIANGLDYATVSNIGSQYAAAAEAYQQYYEAHAPKGAGRHGSAGNLVEIDFSGILEDIRDGLIGAGGSADQFQQSVVKSLVDFNAGVNEALGTIVKALKEIHPDIDIVAEVDVHVVDTQAEVETTAYQRGAA